MDITTKKISSDCYKAMTILHESFFGDCVYMEYANTRYNAIQKLKKTIDSRKRMYDSTNNIYI